MSWSTQPAANRSPEEYVFASTTAIYTGVSDEYRNRLLQRALDRNADRWEAQ